MACLSASRSACGVAAVVALASGTPAVAGGANAIVMAGPAGAARDSCGSGMDSDRLGAAVLVFLSCDFWSCACLTDLSADLSAAFLSGFFVSAAFLSEVFLSEVFLSEVFLL